MFGISFGEAVLLVLLAIVVIGPRDLPKMMRSLGRNVNKVRKAAIDLRDQSGIDEILRSEGIQREILDLQKLATGRIMELGLDEPLLRPLPSRDSSRRTDDPYVTRRSPPRQREYPTGGPDCFDAISEETALYLPLGSDAPVIDTSPDISLDTSGVATTALAAGEAMAQAAGATAGSVVRAEPAADGASHARPPVEGAVARGSLPSGEGHEAA